ncbi:glycosyltransferase family 2 protein [Rhodoblastus sp.]|uniref:glycosyltransferase family 2 protein n=2 Tax=Rhodoblastus sp. TaxID=1962975 RepID=UPI003F944917
MVCSVIICAHTMNRWPHICEAVRSVQAQNAAAKEIILVIDHNRELFDACRKEFPDLKVIESGEARGSSGARNAGVAAATGDFVAFVDDDMVADPDLLKVMIPLFDDPSVAGVGATASPLWLGTPPRWFPDEFLWVVGCTYRGLEGGVVRNVWGPMSFRRSIFQRIGGFDTRLGRNGSKLPISCEETEFSLRLTQAYPQTKLLYAPDAVIEHKVPTDRVTFSYFVLRCFAEGISKARVARMAGAKSLATERNYVLHTLLGGVGRGIADAVTKLDAWAAARAAFIAVGLASTVAGYAWEQLAISLGGQGGEQRAPAQL